MEDRFEDKWSPFHEKKCLPTFVALLKYYSIKMLRAIQKVHSVHKSARINTLTKFKVVTFFRPIYTTLVLNHNPHFAHASHSVPEINIQQDLIRETRDVRSVYLEEDFEDKWSLFQAEKCLPMSVAL